MGRIKKSLKKITAVNLMAAGTILAVSNMQPHEAMASEKIKLSVNKNKVSNPSKYGYLRTESNKKKQINKKA